MCQRIVKLLSVQHRKRVAKVHYIVVHIIVHVSYYFCRLCTGHAKPGKSWNFLFQFPGLKSHRSEVKVMETHSKTSAWQKVILKTEKNHRLI